MLKASNLDQFKPRNPYKNAKAAKDAAQVANSPTGIAPEGSQIPSKDLAVKEAYDVNLSEEAKSKKIETKSSELKTPDIKKPKLDLPSFKPSPLDAHHLTSLKGKKDDKKEVLDARKTSALEADKRGTIKKPGIFFIPGMEIFSNSSSGRYDGMRKMAESIVGARIYGWDQKDEILKEIKKLHVDQPVIIVGHSLGGDTAHEIAEELNEVDNGFRKIDLLVTIDSVGIDNNIVPANVKRNLNIFGEKDFLFNDGPHAPRDAQKTKVMNIIRPEAHTVLDDTKDVQRDIINSIQEILKGKIFGDNAKEKMVESTEAFSEVPIESDAQEITIKLEIS
jgi:esterase/lipase